jgi:WD40 repeat protein
MESHDSTVWKVCFDGTGSRLASCSDDKTLKIWQEYLPGNSEGVVTSGNNPTWKCVCSLSGFQLFLDAMTQNSHPVHVLGSLHIED